MRENMTFLTNYYQIREMTIDRMKEIIDQNKNAKEGGVVLVELLPQCCFILLMKEF